MIVCWFLPLPAKFVAQPRPGLFFFLFLFVVRSRQTVDWPAKRRRVNSKPQPESNWKSTGLLIIDIKVRAFSNKKSWISNKSSLCFGRCLRVRLFFPSTRRIVSQSLLSNLPRFGVCLGFACERLQSDGGVLRKFAVILACPCVMHALCILRLHRAFDLHRTLCC